MTGLSETTIETPGSLSTLVGLLFNLSSNTSYLRNMFQDSDKFDKGNEEDFSKIEKHFQ